MKKFLVTGGTGFIGSHTVVELYNAFPDCQITILDNLVNSKVTVIDKIAKLSKRKPEFIKLDLLDTAGLEQLFSTHHFDTVLHFAGLKAVGESVAQPLRYYYNNLVGTLNLLRMMTKYQLNHIIFSSSATVYGDQGGKALTEDLPTGVAMTNPYGKTKYMIEEILKDLTASRSDFSAIILRYFNPIGAHPSGLLGEDPNGIPTNIMPVITRVFTGKIKTLEIFGNDYDTPDGTCMRDYIHVVDLARGHVVALQKTQGLHIFNLGSCQSTSVLELVQSFSKISGKNLPYHFGPRRAGDLAVVYADASKAKRELGWCTKLSVNDAVRDTINFIQKES